MRAFWLLARMRALDVLRSRSSTAYFVGFPLALLAVLGTIFANGHPFERRRVAIVDERATTDAASLEALEATLRSHDDLHVLRAEDRARATALLRTRMANAALFVGDDRTVLLVGPREELFGRGLTSVLERPATLTRLSVPRWGYVHYLFPGVLAFSILVAGLFGMGYAMVRYRETLFLKKLATTTLRPSTFVAAQIAARTLLVLGQVALLVVVAVLAFDLPLRLTSVAWLALVSALGLVTFMGVGFAIACLVKTESMMVDVISAVNTPLVFLSEMFFPLDELPAFVARFAELLPSTILVRLLREVLLAPEPSLSMLLPNLLGLVLWSVVTFAISLKLFRWID